jgi:hypothetical protein
LQKEYGQKGKIQPIKRKLAWERTREETNAISNQQVQNFLWVCMKNINRRSDEDITMLNTHTPRPFPCWTSSPTQLPRPSWIQPTLTHGFSDNSIIRRRN